MVLRFRTLFRSEMKYLETRQYLSEQYNDWYQNFHRLPCHTR